MAPENFRGHFYFSDQIHSQVKEPNSSVPAVRLTLKSGTSSPSFSRHWERESLFSNDRHIKKQGVNVLSGTGFSL